MRQRNSCIPKPTPESVANKRRHGRITCELLQSTLGEVMDLSASGMRVLIRGRLRTEVGAIHELSLKLLGCRLPVKARVTWIKRTGFLRHHIGVEFLDINEQIERSLNTIASVAQKKRSLV